MRFYRALLHLYPASFRQEYGDGMAHVFAMRARDARGPLAPLALAWEAIVDVVPNAVAAHLDVLGQDLRYTARALRRSWSFALTVVIVVALGVGANTAAFSVADTVLLRPLPFREPDEPVKLWQKTPGYGRMELSPANWRDWKAGARSFTDFGAITFSAFNVVGLGEPVRVQAVRATGEVLPLLGVAPMLGRIPTDSGGDATVVLSHALWRRQFGADSGVVGMTVRLDGQPHVVAAVMPPQFNFPNRDIELWTRLEFREPEYSDRTNTYIHGIARLRPGATLEGAQAEMEAVAARLAAAYPQENERIGANLYRFGDEVSQQSRVLLGALAGAALCILLLACANVGNLLIARAASREREMAVRSALGAGGSRLVRQLLTESMTLTLLGGAAGVLLAVAMVPALTRLVPETLPLASLPRVDGRVLAFAAGLTALVGLVFGLLPARSAWRGADFAALRDGGRSGGGARRRARGVLVAVQVMASVVLVVSSGLLVRAIWSLQRVDPGFDPRGVFTVRTALPFPRYAHPADRMRFYNRVLGEVRALPGVTSAAYVTGLPMAMGGGIWPVQLPGEAAPPPNTGERSIALRFATSQYFRALGVPLLQGRDLSESDDRQAPFVAVVSESFARRLFPGEPALGQRFTVAFFERTIVGVVRDVRQRGLEQESEPQVYVPAAQIDSGWMPFYPPKDLVVRGTLPPAQLLPVVRRVVRAADPDQPISLARTMDEIIGEETASRAAQLRVLSVLAVVALLLAGVGIHGLLSFTVARRSQEMGVRLALGARPGALVRMVLREGLLLAAAGAIPGLLIALAAGRAMRALLAGVQPFDPLTFAAAVLVCVATVVVGCVRPARRAGRVDPMVALRAD